MIFQLVLLGGRRAGVERELDIVTAVRNAHVNPAQLLLVLTALPDILKSQNVPVKIHGRTDGPNQDSNVAHAISNALRRHEIPFCASDPTIRLILNYFHKMT